jgi:hypothetical protein
MSMTLRDVRPDRPFGAADRPSALAGGGAHINLIWRAAIFC